MDVGNEHKIKTRALFHSDIYSLRKGKSKGDSITGTTAAWVIARVV